MFRTNLAAVRIPTTAPINSNCQKGEEKKTCTQTCFQQSSCTKIFQLPFLRFHIVEHVSRLCLRKAIFFCWNSSSSSLCVGEIDVTKTSLKVIFIIIAMTLRAIKILSWGSKQRLGRSGNHKAKMMQEVRFATFIPYAWDVFLHNAFIRFIYANENVLRSSLFKLESHCQERRCWKVENSDACKKNSRFYASEQKANSKSPWLCAEFLLSWIFYSSRLRSSWKRLRSTLDCVEIFCELQTRRRKIKDLKRGKLGFVVIISYLMLRSAIAI